MITENLSTLKIHKLTQEQYDREVAAGNIDTKAIYLTPDTPAPTILYIPQALTDSQKLQARTNIGAVDTSELSTQIETSLTEAKESGEFDGADGADGSVWFTGTIVTTTMILQVVSGAKEGDMYLNTNTYDVYQANATQWVKVGNIKGATGDDGTDGERGTSVLKITTAPSSYTTTTGGFTPTYRIALSTVKTQSNTNEVKVGDTVLYTYYMYPVGYVDSSYVYLGARNSIRGTAGSAGTSIYINDVTESTTDGGENVVTFSDGNTLTIKNGSKGSTGTAGSKWFCGTAVANDTTAVISVSTARIGDYYLNTNTNNYYLGDSTGLWVKQGKLGMTDAETKAYIDDLILNGEW